MAETLIRVLKDGASLLVHPTCLAAHERAGWTVSLDQTDVEPEAPASTEDWRELTVPKLKELAEFHNVDLGDATKKADIVKAMEQAERVGDSPTRREIEADLIAMEVDFDPTHDLADLLAQRNEARAKRDAEAQS